MRDAEKQRSRRRCGAAVVSAAIFWIAVLCGLSAVLGICGGADTSASDGARGVLPMRIVLNGVAEPRAEPTAVLGNMQGAAAVLNPPDVTESFSADRSIPADNSRVPERSAPETDRAPETDSAPAAALPSDTLPPGTETTAVRTFPSSSASFVDTSGNASGAVVTEPAVLALLDRKILDNVTYPERARRRAVEGSVTVAVSIGSYGTLDSYRIEAGSGSVLLDDAAAALIERVFPLTESSYPYPVNTTVRIVYVLRPVVGSDDLM